jgi:two-component system chemotaxis response regulator CheY
VHYVTDEDLTMSHAPTFAPPRPTRRARILLADDDLAARSTLATQLASAGYDVVEVRDGEQALAVLGSALVGAVEPIDLVVSDDCMPGPTGLEVLGGIRDQSRSVPVILLTSFADPYLRGEAARLEASALLEKPVDQESFTHTVAGIVSRSATRSFDTARSTS